GNREEVEDVFAVKFSAGRLVSLFQSARGFEISGAHVVGDGDECQFVIVQCSLVLEANAGAGGLQYAKRVSQAMVEVRVLLLEKVVGLVREMLYIKLKDAVPVAELVWILGYVAEAGDVFGHVHESLASDGEHLIAPGV